MSERSDIRAELLGELLAHFGKEHDEYTKRFIEQPSAGAFERGHCQGAWSHSIYVLEQLRGWDAEV